MNIRKSKIFSTLFCIDVKIFGSISRYSDIYDKRFFGQMSQLSLKNPKQIMNKAAKSLKKSILVGFSTEMCLVIIKFILTL